MKLVFATSNPNKVKEIVPFLPNHFEILSLRDIGLTEDIPENEPTIEGNAKQKAQYVWDRFQLPVFGEDTGLLVDALNGAPGVHTARFAGAHKNDEDNINLMIQKLSGVDHRAAHFKTVIAYFDGKLMHTFEGICEGEILQQRTGNDGFGYDPIFQPKGYDRSFAQMTIEEKAKISHRGKALRAFLQHPFEIHV